MRPRSGASSRVLAVALWTAAGLGCAGETQVVLAPTVPKTNGVTFADDGVALKRFRSVRFNVSLPLPDGAAWRIDDHSRGELVATHAATSSTVTLALTTTGELVNRRSCEKAARDAGLVPGSPGSPELRTIEDDVISTPDGLDARVWVALQPGGKPGVPLVGHVFEFGASVRKCLFFHFQSEVPTDALEDVLSARLATARLRIVPGIVLPPFDEIHRERLPRGR